MVEDPEAEIDVALEAHPCPMLLAIKSELGSRRGYTT